MKKNVGNADRFLRVILGIILLIVSISGVLRETAWQWIVLAASAILIITSFASFCPLYAMLGKSTTPLRRKGKKQRT